MLLGGRVELDATRMADQARKAGPLIVTEIPHPYWFGEKRNAKTQDLMAGAKAAEGAGRYAEALRLYEAAYLLTERTGYLLRLADMRALLGHHTIAAALYHRVASDKYSHPSEREEAAEKIERLALDEEQLRTISGGARPKPAAAAPAAAKPAGAAPPANGSAAAAAPPPKVGALRRTLPLALAPRGGSGRRPAGDAGRTTADRRRRRGAGATAQGGAGGVSRRRSRRRRPRPRPRRRRRCGGRSPSAQSRDLASRRPSRRRRRRRRSSRSSSSRRAPRRTARATSTRRRTRSRSPASSRTSPK